MSFLWEHCLVLEHRIQIWVILRLGFSVEDIMEDMEIVVSPYKNMGHSNIMGLGPFHVLKELSILLQTYENKQRPGHHGGYAIVVTLYKKNRDSNIMGLCSLHVLQELLI